jgi:hypothetical protein
MSNNQQASVDINVFVDELDLSLVVGRTRPSLRTEERPHTYSAWIPHVIVSETNSQMIGYGDSMTEAVAALAEGISNKEIRITINGANDGVIAPTITTEGFGSDE